MRYQQNSTQRTTSCHKILVMAKCEIATTDLIELIHLLAVYNNEEVWSGLMIVSGDEELVCLSLHLIISLQSDDCCHCQEHWDVCSEQEKHTLIMCINIDLELSLKEDEEELYTHVCCSEWYNTYHTD